jgi:ABC-2 type transport system permease protein
MNKFMTLLKREYWENRTGFAITPIAIGGFIILVLLIGLLNTEHMMSTHKATIGPVSVSGLGVSGMDFIASVTKEFATLELETRTNLWEMAFYCISVCFSVVLLIISLNYMLGALYDDRKDRSILFWKSLPVSDLMTVTSKIVTLLILIPLCFTLAVTATYVVVLLIATFAAMFGSGSIWAGIWEPAPFISAPLNLFTNYVMQTLWAAPLLGWILLVSSWTKRKPILVATIPLGVIIFVELYYYRTTEFLTLVLDRLRGWLAPIDFDTGHHLISGEEINSPIEMYQNPWMFLNSNEFWYGLVLAAVFFAASVYIRRFRDES